MALEALHLETLRGSKETVAADGTKTPAVQGVSSCVAEHHHHWQLREFLDKAHTKDMHEPEPGVVYIQDDDQARCISMFSNLHVPDTPWALIILVFI